MFVLVLVFEQGEEGRFVVVVEIVIGYVLSLSLMGECKGMVGRLMMAGWIRCNKDFEVQERMLPLLLGLCLLGEGWG